MRERESAGSTYVEGIKRREVSCGKTSPALQLSPLPLQWESEEAVGQRSRTEIAG